ncbi:MAG: LysR family transcriptional regulator [Pseudomonadales bacterium]|nr:LysR family transcriptional regulator [Pseudomonadales bacterium]
MLDELKTFVITAQEGSLTRAADQLGTTVATVSRHIDRLEAHTGQRLLHRSPRGLTLTQAGDAYFGQCEELVTALDERLANLDQSINSLKGTLRVMAPNNFALGPLAEFWNHWLHHFPDTDLNLDLNNQFGDIKHAQADIAIRIGPQPDSSLIQKRLGDIRTILVAHPDWTTHPELDWSTDPESLLQKVPTVGTTALQHWTLTNDCGQSITIHGKHRHLTNDLEMSLHLVRSGAGITLVPLSSIVDQSNDQLVQVLPNWYGMPRPVYLVWPYRNAISARARVFAEELTAFLAKQHWFQAV